jgi:phosphatidylglycerol:prolipoprotein diacylglycerol transferase
LSPFILEFGGGSGVGIRYYGLAYALGLVCGGLLMLWYGRAGRSLVRGEKVWDFVIALILGVVIGARLGYFVFYRPDLLASEPLSVFQLWKDGGMSSHGGFLGVLLACVFFAWRNKLPLPHLLDITATVAPAGLFFGRVANFINGELWGRVTTVRWAVIFPAANDPAGVARHPSQLYEGALEGLLLFLFIQLRFWKTDWVFKKPGRLTGEFLLAYAAARIVCENFRQADIGVEPILGLQRGIFYSLLLAAAGLFFTLRKSRAIPPPLRGEK